MVRRGHPDREIVKVVSAEFECCENTIRNDLRRVWEELREEDAAKREERRHVLRYQLEALQVEVRDVAEKARDGFEVIGPDGEPTVVQDMKTASMALSTAEKLFGRLVQLDGVSETDKVKGDLLRLKFLKESGLTENDLDRMIAEEVGKRIDAMTAEELELMAAKRRGQVA